MDCCRMMRCHRNEYDRPRLKLACRPLALLFLALAGLYLTACRYPQDVKHTLDRIEGGVMHVGVTENAPWVEEADNGGASGYEAEVVMDLARNLDADVRWHWGTEGELIEALKQFELDLVIGGLTKSPRLTTVVALTKPYYQSRITVGFPSGRAGVPPTLEGEKVGVERTDHLSKIIREHGAEPVTLPEPGNSTIAVAGPTWWLHAHGYEPGPWELDKRLHVMALPTGENAWMMAVQRHLNALSDPGRRLQQLEGGE